jgi:hypothetical protein
MRFAGAALQAMLPNRHGTIITVGVPAQPAVVFLRHATIVGFLSRSVTNA